VIAMMGGCSPAKSAADKPGGSLRTYTKGFDPRWIDNGLAIYREGWLGNQIHGFGVFT